MITYDRAPLWQRRWFLALVCLAVAAGLACVWWLGRGDAELVSVAGPAASASVGSVTPGAPWGAKPQLAPDGRPSDFQPAEWAALKQAMAQTAQPETELARIVASLRFQRGVSHWQALQRSSDVALRQQTARSLLDLIPDRLRQGDITLGEALLLEAALWTELEPDEGLRRQRLEAAQVRLGGLAPQVDAEQQDREAAQLAEYKRREAAIVADWQASPPAERSQARLEESLESARRAVYGSKN